MIKIVNYRSLNEEPNKERNNCIKLLINIEMYHSKIKK